jgi:hypothetical protein
MTNHSVLSFYLGCDSSKWGIYIRDFKFIPIYRHQCGSTAPVKETCEQGEYKFECLHAPSFDKPVDPFYTGVPVQSPNAKWQLFADVEASTQTTSDFWDTKCAATNGSARYWKMKIVMGNTTDFFAGAKGQTFCGALKTGANVLWSPTEQGPFIEIEPSG